MSAPELISVRPIHLPCTAWAPRASSKYKRLGRPFVTFGTAESNGGHVADIVVAQALPSFAPSIVPNPVDTHWEYPGARWTPCAFTKTTRRGLPFVALPAAQTQPPGAKHFNQDTTALLRFGP